MVEGRLGAKDPLALVGTVVGEKYRIEKLVGEGGFALVYRAEHLVWKQPVAIKFFHALSHANVDQHATLLQDFLREGALLTELSAKSASIVQARDVGELTTEAGAWVPYMVLEWLAGVSLEQYLAELTEAQVDPTVPVPWSVEAALSVLSPVGDVLGLVHKSGVVHRDIKPSNIFLVGELPAPDGTQDEGNLQVKLLDFGVAKAVASAADLAKTSTVGITSFTPAYGAPEQFSRQWGATGPWTDVFALALVGTELLSGRVALNGEDFVQLGFASTNPNFRPTPRNLGAAVTDSVEAVFEKALALRPEDRFENGGAFLRALRAAADGREIPASGLPSLRGASTTPHARGSVTARSSVDEGAKTALAPTAPTMVAAEAPSPSPRKSAAPLVAAMGLVATIGVGGLWLSSKAPKGENGNTIAASSSAPAASSVASVTPPKTTCPEGMIAISGGEFFQGSNSPPDKYAEDEKPAHHVVLAPYCIDKTEVTVAQYKACSDKGMCLPAENVIDFPGATAEDKKTYAPLCTAQDLVLKGDHPLNCIDWAWSNNFCTRMQKRLPTEAEWEFAARGPDGRTYSWGNEPPDETRMNACGKECEAWGKKNKIPLTAMHGGDDGFPTTAPVGSFPKGASRFGLLDVEGNVWEWTADFYAPYTQADTTNPKGPDLAGTKGAERVIRGGAFNGAAVSWVRPTKRFKFAPEARTHAIGFRCASDPIPAK